MAVRLSALRTSRPSPPGRFLVLIFVRGWVDPRDIVLLEGLVQLKNSMTSGTQAVWCETDRSSLFGVKITNVWSDTSTSTHLFMASCLFKLRNKFALCHNRDSCQSVGLGGHRSIPRERRDVSVRKRVHTGCGANPGCRIQGLSGRSVDLITSIHCWGIVSSQLLYFFITQFTGIRTALRFISPLSGESDLTYRETYEWLGIMPRFEQGDPKTVTTTQSCLVHLGYMGDKRKTYYRSAINFKILLS
jgi:hypothetical protein